MLQYTNLKGFAGKNTLDYWNTHKLRRKYCCKYDSWPILLTYYDHHMMIFTSDAACTIKVFVALTLALALASHQSCS
jgi:hypothetical protein